MVVYQYLISAFVIGILCLVYFVFGKKWEKGKDRFAKIVSLVLLACFFVRYMSGNDILRYTGDKLALENIYLNDPTLSFFTLIINWFMYGVELLIIMYPFYRKTFMANIIRIFCFPVSILCLIGLYVASVGIVGYDAYNAFNFRIILMAIEFGISAFLCFKVFMENGKFKIDKKSGLKLLYIIPLMLLAVMPSYTIQSLFGQSRITLEIEDLNVYHRLILYGAILIPIGLYFLLRKYDKETCRIVLLYISLGTLLSFSLGHKFDDFTGVTGWPFHLCNTAMYIMPLCLMFKWDKLFYFTLFINVLGALFAMLMPNTTSGLFSRSLVNFYINHYIAFFMPVLIVALRVYDRPKLRQFMYSMVGFGAYFLLVLILNAWFSNYDQSVDYFFINSDFIADKLGKWAEDLRNVTVSFSIGDLKFLFYPIYQILFFLCYVALGAGMWFVYEWAYQSVDTLYDIADRKQKIKLDQLALEAQLDGRSKMEPMDLKGVNKLELINFSKRYGNSNVYAVKDANLTINGGEIFGFLGPNGAGKSTIIKSIVGIQPITEGKIHVCGYDVDTQSAMAKRLIGFVPDHYALYSKLTGREYINYIADLYQVSQEDREKAMEKYVTMLQLTDAFDNKIETYSHGMKQKISIISALIHNPKVWILDEPLIGLDPTSIFQVKECMKEHAKQGNIVFFSSHIIDVVERVCDRVAIIKKGHILDCKDVDEIEEKMSVEDFYLNTINNNDVQPYVVDDPNRKLSKEEKKALKAQQKAEKKQAKLDKKEAKALAKQQKLDAKANKDAEPTIVENNEVETPAEPVVTTTMTLETKKPSKKQPTEQKKQTNTTKKANAQTKSTKSKSNNTKTTKSKQNNKKTTKK